MAGDVFCVLTAVLTLAAVVFMVRYVFARPAQPIFDGWQDVLDGWAYVRARDLVSQLLFLALLLRYLKGPVFLIALAPFLTTVGALATAVCGWNEAELRIVHAIIKDLIQAFENAGATPEAG